MATHGFGVCWAMLPIVLSATVVLTPDHESLGPRNVPVQTGTRSSQEVLDAMEKRFVEYDTHFIDFSEKSDASFELEVATELEAVASETYDYIHATNMLLLVYSHISCKEDRATIKPFLKDEFHGYSELIDRQLKIVKLKGQV